MRKTMLFLVIASVFFASCFKKDVNNAPTCTYDPCGVKASDSELTRLEAYLSASGITSAIKHCSGVYYQILNPGADIAPTVCSYVAVNYTGRLTNDSVFQQTTAPIAIGLPNVIAGWKVGLPLIKKGGKIRLYIPPSLGYGALEQKDQQTGKVVIPAYSIIIFDIELIDLQ